MQKFLTFKVRSIFYERVITRVEIRFPILYVKLQFKDNFRSFISNIYY